MQVRPPILSNAVNSRLSATSTETPLRSSAKRWAVQKVGCTSGSIAIRPPSPRGSRRARDGLRPPRAKRPRRSQRKSFGCIKPYRQTHRGRCALGSFETISVNTVSPRSLRCAPSIAFSTVRHRRGPHSPFNRKRGDALRGNRLFDANFPGAALGDRGYPPGNRLRPSARRRSCNNLRSISGFHRSR